jgi:hypothetical protein
MDIDKTRSDGHGLSSFTHLIENDGKDFDVPEARRIPDPLAQSFQIPF